MFMQRGLYGEREGAEGNSGEAKGEEEYERLGVNERGRGLTPKSGEKKEVWVRNKERIRLKSK